MKTIRHIIGMCLLLITPAASSDAVADDVVLVWNQVLSDVLLADTTAQNPGMASRSMALTNIAMYDALNTADPNDTTFYAHSVSGAEASPQAAALQAGYRVLAEIYPEQRLLLDAERDAIAAGFPNTPSTTAGLELGDVIGRNVVQRRVGDGFDTMVPYNPKTDLGHWQPDPMNPSQTAWGPEWGSIQPLSLPNTELMMPPPMPKLTSAEYSDAFNEVKQLGSVDSAARTPEQTQIGLFWAYDRLGMGTPMRLYNRILSQIARDQGNDLTENARLFAMASTAMCDAGIVAWDSKFRYDFWRPVSGIRNADDDGNPHTIADPNWVPLGAPGGALEDGTIINDFTPPFPTYVSGHASFGGALFRSLQEFYGTDDIAFQIASEETPGVTRNFDTLSEAMLENGRSRVYLGIHWNFDDEFARYLGNEVAAYVAANEFQPVPEPTTATLALVAIVALSCVRRQFQPKAG